MPCLFVCTDSEEMLGAVRRICEGIGWDTSAEFTEVETGNPGRGLPQADAALFDLLHGAKRVEERVPAVATAQPFLPLVFVSEGGLASAELGSGLRYHIDATHLDDLEHILISLSCSLASGGELGSRSRGSNSFAPRILVVDDNAQLTSLVARTLRSMEKFDVEVANSGAEAGAILTGFHPDIAIIDLVLGDMDGREVCALIRRHDSLKDTKIIAVSGYLTEEHMREGETYYDVFLEKPFRMSEMVEKVTACLP